MDADRIYRPRSIASLGLWRVRTWTYKAYGVHFDPNQVRMFTAQRLEAARIHAANQLELADRVGEHESVGYLILHQGRDHLWHLQHWWAQGDVVAGYISRANETNQFVRVSEPYVGSVWDMAIISYERDAWIRTMLMPMPDVKAYLSQWLPNGLY